MLFHYVLLQALITRYHEAVQRTTAKACKKYLLENVFKNVSKVSKKNYVEKGGSAKHFKENAKK